jgi:hypothetical protein
MTARPEEGLYLMPRKTRPAPEPVTGWLDQEQQRAWLAYIEVQLRLVYEMNRQLQSTAACPSLTGTCSPRSAQADLRA